MDRRTPFAVLLIGQATVVRHPRMGVFAALEQHLATRYRLRPMDLAEAARYLCHHFARAGRTGPLFAAEQIAAYAGVPAGSPAAYDLVRRLVVARWLRPLPVKVSIS